MFVLASVLESSNESIQYPVGTGSCPTPVCPEGRQVVATCTVTDATGSFNTFWGGDSITSCPQDFIVLAHALDTSASGVCAGTTFRADIVSVEANNFSSHLSLIPTTSHNGQRIGCYSPTQSDLIQECTLDVLGKYRFTIKAHKIYEGYNLYEPMQIYHIL